MEITSGTTSINMQQFVALGPQKQQNQEPLRFQKAPVALSRIRTSLVLLMIDIAGGCFGAVRSWELPGEVREAAQR